MKQVYEEWEIAVNAIPDPVSIHDKDYRIVKANKAFAEAVGKEPQEFIGKRCYEIVHRTKVPWCNCPHKQTLENHRPVTEEFWEPYLGIYVKAHTSPILNERNEVIASVHIAKNITDQKRAEEELGKRTDELGERVKELKCLYAFSNLLERPGISLPEVFKGLTAIVPAGWQYPDITCARLVIKHQVFKTVNFRETLWKQSSPVLVDGESEGTLEVYYLEEKPERHEGPFLKEERDLLNALASRLGQTIKLLRAEEALQEG